MLTLAWQTIRSRLGGFAGAFIAILCGTALVAACGVLMESGLRAGVPTQRYAAAAVVVGGAQTVRPPGADALSTEQVGEQPSVPVALAGRIAAVPGVRAAVAEQSFPAQVVSRDGQVLAGRESLGHNWDAAVLAPFTLRGGDAPATAGEVVLDADLARRADVGIGGQVRITTRSGTEAVKVSGVVDGTSRQSAVFFTPQRAAELAGRPGQAHAIGVLAEPGVEPAALAERVRAVADGAEVTTGIERSSIEFLDVSQTRTLLLAIAGSFGGFALLVAVFVVASTLALTINQRRREFALLRAVAATPRQIRKLIGTETTLIALVAGVLGSVLGLAVAGGLRDAFAAIGVIPADFGLAISPLPLLAAVLLGLGAARLAAWAAARRPSSIRPVEALGEAAVERRELGRGRLLTGWGLVLAGFGGTLVPLFLRGDIAAATSSMATLVIVIGLAVVGPQVTGLVMRFLVPVLARLWRISGYLAGANGHANARRVAAAVTPLMLAVAFALATFYGPTAMTAAAQQESARSTTADYVLTAPGGVSPEVAAAAGRVPGVAAATPVVRTSVITASTVGDSVEVQRTPAQGLAGGQAGAALELGVDAGRLTDLTGDTVALSRSEADWLDKKLGDEVEFYFGDGVPAKLRLVATYRHDLAFGDFVLPVALAREHIGGRLDDSVLIRRQPGADAGAVGAALNALPYPGLVVAPAAVVAAPEGGERQAQFYLNLVAAGVIVGYLAISVANTLVLTTAQRGREFALLRLVGTTRRQVTRMMRLEALATVGIAVVMGTLVAVIPLALLNIGLRGNPVPAGPPSVYFGIIAGAVLLGMVAIGVATTVALRARPIDAIGLRE
ncbi:ABC transporter permease [Amycolatopsis mediterranei]|nr:ABC transporter permease [Amycolatopsis mediterranei]KDO05115.1 ABC transporter permease [Amycolatopsis mediterranei]KDU90245.1 ABC transporter permease [Amycolatopsis mediterranei]UZF76036.1 ABC transporter permease [Amycolatopsis mediterranei]